MDESRSFDVYDVCPTPTPEEADAASACSGPHCDAGRFRASESLFGLVEIPSPCIRLMQIVRGRPRRAVGTFSKHEIKLISEIRSRLDEPSKHFLLSFHAVKPDWNLFGLPHVRSLPAIRWKLMNLECLHSSRPEKYLAMIESLSAMLSGARE
jgi:hypothetical protein